jgi:Helix-turn-helix domain
MTKVPSLPRGKRLRDKERSDVAAELLRRYNSGKSIRDICAETGYSIGRVRRMLEEAGVEFRRRGGRPGVGARAARGDPRVMSPSPSQAEPAE